MAGREPRYRFILVEEPATTLPVRYRRSGTGPRYWVRRTEPMEALIEALLKLSRRGEGQEAWAPPLAQDPLTFLLDAIGDAIVVRQPEGEVLYANPAARRLGVEHGICAETSVLLQELQLDGRHYERRCMTFTLGESTLVLEVLRRVDDQ